MYQDPIIQKYLELLKAKCGWIKEFYQGEPIKIPATNYPCVMISKRGTRVRAFTNTEDEQSIELSLTLITDVRKDLSTEDDIAKIVAGVSSLYDQMEGRDADFKLKPETLLNVLRTNPVVDSVRNLRTDLGTVTTVDYSQTLANRAPAQWSIEARVDFVAYFTQVR